MRRQFFEMLDSGGENFDELVVEASARIKRPKTEEQADMSIGYVQPTGTESAAPQK
jgi:formate dehydrogenase subunit delta